MSLQSSLKVLVFTTMTDDLDIFYLYFGLLRNAIKEVSPSTWKNILDARFYDPYVNF